MYVVCTMALKDLALYFLFENCPLVTNSHSLLLLIANVQIEIHSNRSQSSCKES